MKAPLAFITALMAFAFMERPDDLVQSNRRGLQKLRKAAEQHGSLSSGNLRLTLDIECAEYRNGTQAKVSQAPFESYAWRRRHHIDRAGRVESIRTRNEFAGFVFEDEILDRAGVAVRFDHPTRTKEKATIGPAIYHFLPQRYIEAALRNPLSVRLQGAITLGSRPASLVDMVDGGATHRLFLDEESGLVLRTDVLRHADPYGETVRTYAFDGSQPAGGLTLPRVVTVTTTDSVLGSIRNIFKITAAAEGEGGLPAVAHEGFTEASYAARAATSIRILAKDVYLIENLTNSTEQWSYNVLFAEFADHILVAEAPLDDRITRQVMSQIASVAPGKPIRYLVQSHHHDDHIGGIRGYVAAGTRLIVTPGNEELIRRIAAASHSARPDVLADVPRLPEFEVVSGSKILRDERLEARIYDVGPTSHANEMLVVHFPAQGVLFQSDLINAGEFPGAERAALLIERARALGLEVRVLAGAHGEVLTGAALQAIGFE